MIDRLELVHFERGEHRGPNEGGCMMEWVSWLAGEPWSDNPTCVSPVIAAFCRTWNDHLPEEQRDPLLKPLARTVISTATGEADDQRRAWMCADWLIRTHLPAWCDLTPALAPHAAALRALAEIDSPQALEGAKGPLDVARVAAAAAAREAAWYAAREAAREAAWYAARAVARGAGGAAAGAGDAAGAAAGTAAWAATWAVAVAGIAARAAARAAARDAVWGAGAAAAGDSLASTVLALQASAVELVQRMCAVGR